MRFRPSFRLVFVAVVLADLAVLGAIGLGALGTAEHAVDECPE